MSFRPALFNIIQSLINFLLSTFIHDCLHVIQKAFEVNHYMFYEFFLNQHRFSHRLPEKTHI